MERLTNAKEAAAQRRAYEKRLEQGYPRNIPEERFLKLAAYEDTGLEPCDYTAMRNAMKQADRAKDDLAEIIRIMGGTGIDRLVELAQADREGRCVVLPSGDYADKDGENALKSAMNTCFYHNNPVTRYIADAVAEKLTREEAEAALKEKER